jgi:RimJ/RimL family protein N-acetyltransferase
VITLQTERLLLRMFRESDLNDYAEMCGDPEVMRYLGDGQTMSREDAWRHMAMVLGHWHLRGYGLWAVEERASGEMIGRIGCYNPEGWPQLEVGWALRRCFWGRGYAIEGARASLRFAFTELNAEHVVSVIHPQNAASIRVAEKLGERFERTAEVRGFEISIYGLWRKDWRAGRQATDAPSQGQTSGNGKHVS